MANANLWHFVGCVWLLSKGYVENTIETSETHSNAKAKITTTTHTYTHKKKVTVGRKLSLNMRGSIKFLLEIRLAQTRELVKMLSHSAKYSVDSTYYKGKCHQICIIMWEGRVGNQYAIVTRYLFMCLRLTRHTKICNTSQ